MPPLSGCPVAATCFKYLAHITAPALYLYYIPHFMAPSPYSGTKSTDLRMMIASCLSGRITLIRPLSQDELSQYDETSQSTLNLSKLETYADMQKSGGSDNDDTSQITMENHPLQGEGNVVSLSEEGGEEEDKGVDQEIKQIVGETTKRTRPKRALRISTRHLYSPSTTKPPSKPSPSTSREVSQPTPVHDKAMCLTSINGILGAADVIAKEDNQTRKNAGELFCEESVSPEGHGPSKFLMADFGGGREIDDGPDSDYSSDHYTQLQAKQYMPQYAPPAKKSSVVKKPKASKSGIKYTAPPPGAEIVPDDELLNASDDEILGLALRDHRTKKHLLLEMALSRDNPRTSLVDPKAGIIGEGFFWGNYPKLERVLRARMDEYYELSTAKRQSKEQQQFNNQLVESIRIQAEANGWVFDPKVFDDKKIRDRIRCFFKTHIQNAKKRLKTVLKNQHKKTNENLIASARDAVEIVVSGGSAANAVKVAAAKRKMDTQPLEKSIYTSAKKPRGRKNDSKSATNSNPHHTNFTPAVRTPVPRPSFGIDVEDSDEDTSNMVHNFKNPHNRRGSAKKHQLQVPPQSQEVIVKEQPYIL
ncbi:hypothetical protein TrLO_g15624 [Triparma laevis f. longispina]|uniref:Uncharacterized protein n=1 Tax=Triparma laevis f. longispina TaxID=1714387 RepID=A0A9W7FQY9_9STRA|nr:hypothetical protein TrLO_g15624 [Triparma laevis f. longispina]